MIGVRLPLARYAAPIARMKRTGEVERLLLALGRSLPRGESPTPITRMSGSTAFSPSYAMASTRW
jgi:hypothetical protein